MSGMAATLVLVNDPGASTVRVYVPELEQATVATSKSNSAKD
jgi:hypothetical protein